MKKRFGFLIGSLVLVVSLMAQKQFEKAGEPGSKIYTGEKATLTGKVTDAQTTLVTERLALYQAIFDYQTALGRLRQATGR